MSINENRLFDGKHQSPKQHNHVHSVPGSGTSSVVHILFSFFSRHDKPMPCSSRHPLYLQEPLRVVDLETRRIHAILTSPLQLTQLTIIFSPCAIVRAAPFFSEVPRVTLLGLQSRFGDKPLKF